MKNNTLPEIRPCPCCDKATLLEKHHYDDVISYGIHCDCSFADDLTENLGPFKKRQNPKTVIKNWNKAVCAVNLFLFRSKLYNTKETTNEKVN